MKVKRTKHETETERQGRDDDGDSVDGKVWI
jgi:hypothetical protein